METTTYIIATIILIALWLVLRPVFLWYWKLDRIVALQEEQIILLRKLLKLDTDIEIHNETEDHNFIEGVVFSIPEGTEHKYEEIIRSKASKLGKGQLLAFDTYTKRTDFFKIEEYHQFMKTANRPTLVIAAIKE